MTDQERMIINSFHDLYYNGLGTNGPIYAQTYWFNIPCFKCPLDLWISPLKVRDNLLYNNTIFKIS